MLVVVFVSKATKITLIVHSTMTIEEKSFFAILFVLIAGTLAVDLEKNLLKTWKDNRYYGFRGIRYAEPPTGPRRFMAPIPISSWQNLSSLFENDLIEAGSECPQPGSQYNEDCLYLNVYTKSLGPIKLKPVIVFIHPGGLYIGDSNFGADYLLEKDVVLVTFNYRLAFFGFTSTGTSDVTPNAGFKDQVLALKWVRDHIAHFGGDPHCVTLMGISAGGLSVELHLVSPLSRGLFHRAVQMSGGVLPQRKLPTEQNYLVTRLAKLINCDDAVRAIDCIKNASTRSIADNLRKIFDFGYDHPVYPWLPIIESHSEDAFLQEDPFKMLARGDFAKVPILLSNTKLEAAMLGIYFEKHEDELNEFLLDFQRIGPICLMYERNDTVSAEFQTHYIDPTDGIRKKIFYAISQANSAALAVFPIHRLAQLLKNQTNVYLMRFSYVGTNNRFPCATLVHDDQFCKEIEAEKIVAHLDDLNYLLTWKASAKIPASSMADAKIVEKYTTLLANFAQTGIPDFGDEIQPLEAQYDDTQRYIDFNENFTVATKPFEDYELWDRLFPIDV